MAATTDRFSLTTDGSFFANDEGFWQYPKEDYWFVKVEKEWPMLFSSLEKKNVTFHITGWIRSHSWCAITATMMYLLFVWCGPKLMANRRAFDLRGPLKYWNLFLAIFSLAGAIRAVHHVVALNSRFSFLTIACAPGVYSLGGGAVSLWSLAFVFSKFAELIDTVFMVLRKRPVSFLHWYHHATVLLYTWDCMANEQGHGIYYCTMNYIVHTIMYFYYYLALERSKPPRWGFSVTILQIAQMLIGVFLTGYLIWLSHSIPQSKSWTVEQVFNQEGRCFIARKNIVLAGLMYSTYLYLFVDFFARRYFFNRRGTADKCLSMKSGSKQVGLERTAKKDQ